MLVEAGKLAPRLDDRRFSLHQADVAHDLFRDGSVSGKVVVELIKT
jgi:NADPH2:quinone reductase